MGITSILKDVRTAKTGNTYASFHSHVAKQEWFNQLVDEVMSRTSTWATKVGILKSKETVDKDIPKEEAVWKKYFKDHTFRSPEESRNIADLIEILTGVSPHKYIVAPKETAGSRTFFPPYICVIPTGNTNGHDYEIGSPILSFGMSPIFIKSDGDTGNNMTTNIDHISVPTRDQVVMLISRVMYISSSMTERIITGVGIYEPS